MQITLTAETYKEMADRLYSLADVFADAKPKDRPSRQEFPHSLQEAVGQAAQTETKTAKKTKTLKVEKIEVTEQPEVKVEAKPKTKEISKEEVKQHVQAMFSKHGLDLSRKVLLQVTGVDSLMLVKPDKYAELIAACKAQMK